jgi:hypothetical protein
MGTIQIPGYMHKKHPPKKHTPKKHTPKKHTPKKHPRKQLKTPTPQVINI